MAIAIACAPADGSLGAPCDVGNDCGSGLLCDLHEGDGSCQHAHTDVNEPEVRDCSTEVRAEQYTAGLAHDGAWVHVALVDAMPAPPSRGDNTWRVTIGDRSGTSLDDLDVEVEPFMPDHFHGTTIRCGVEPGDAPGEFLLAPVNLFMPGVWEVTLRIHDAASASTRDDDEVKFTFCVDP